MNRRDSKVERLIPLQVGSVKKLLAKKHGLVLANNSDKFVARCLRIRDGNVENAVKVILTYKTTLALFMEWGAVIRPSVYESLYRKGAVSILRERDSMGRLVCVVRSKFWDPSEFSYEEVSMALYMMCEHCVSEFQDIQVIGYVTILDFSDFTWQQFWAVNQWRLLTAVRTAQNGVAGRMGAMHTIFHPKAIGILYSGVRPFLKAKLRERIVFHDSVESLHRFVSPKILPDFLGGMLTMKQAAEKSVINELLLKDKYFEDLVSAGLPP